MDVELHEAIASIPFFASMSKENLLEISEHLKLKEYKKGEQILRRGERATHVHFVVEYWAVWSEKVPKNGARILDRIHDAGNFLGNTDVFSPKTRERCTAVATQDCHVLQIEMAYFLKLLGQYHFLNQYVQEVLSAESVYYQARRAWAEASANDNGTHQRVIAALDFLIDSGFAEIDESQTIIKLTHSDLAALVGTTRETITKRLCALFKSGRVIRNSEENGIGKIVLLSSAWQINE